jgi:hypothetical protein
MKERAMPGALFELSFDEAVAVLVAIRADCFPAAVSESDRCALEVAARYTVEWAALEVADHHLSPACETTPILKIIEAPRRLR